MKNISLMLLMSFVLLSCGNKTESKDSNSKKIDPFEQRVNKFMSNEGMDGCPVRIDSSRIKYVEYISILEVTYTNISDKDIKAVKFEYYITDSLGAPAIMRNDEKGFSRFEVPEAILVGMTKNLPIDGYTKNGKKVEKIVPYEVVFSDDTKWLRSNN